MVTSSLIMIIWSSEAIGILFGRIAAGFGHGLVYSIVVVHAGENAINQIRGTILSMINCLQWFAIFVGSLLVATVHTGLTTSATINSDRMIGIFSLAFSFFALMYTLFWTEESIVYLLNRGKLGEALELMSKLRNEPETSTSIADEFEEMRLMVNRDKLENENILKNNNVKPLTLMVGLKFVHVLTNNFLFNWIFMKITLKVLPTGNRRLSPVILTAARFSGSFLQTFFGDSFGRKKFLNASCTMSVVTLLILEIMLITINNHEDYTTVTDWVQCTLCILFQFFVAFGIDPMHSVILSEAFGTTKKRFSIVFVTTCENLAQMVFIGCCFIDGAIKVHQTLHVVLFVSVSFIILLVVVLVFYLPETRGLSLSKTRDLFRNVTTRCLSTKR